MPPGSCFVSLREQWRISLFFTARRERIYSRQTILTRNNQNISFFFEIISANDFSTRKTVNSAFILNHFQSKRPRNFAATHSTEILRFMAKFIANSTRFSEWWSIWNAAFLVIWNRKQNKTKKTIHSTTVEKGLFYILRDIRYTLSGQNFYVFFSSSSSFGELE